ncbi:hypothetical protein [Vibrio vulnificus]|uniref:Helicase n=1 Tax=Vibrio vulnificus TaxID=672 RepID=A0A6S4Q831_VIBVL|nr:hypothetical protein [Vibrio vulnificus]AXX59766.1 hypothetical protein FORC53_1427 [Vibrio vulnificus]EGQ9833512.1 hypothetical protein [Vibrio vulnificus]EHU4945843.1 hypothetical protein [Vibrio vulnificus]EJY4613177.1 hypothetical protein [Vibrio vulnificus]ELH4920202.1 hypothetical protein [Vibrio vulnificus]
MQCKEWKVELGTLSKDELLFELSKNKINFNAYAVMLFMSQEFEISKERQTIELVKVSVRELGYPEGALYVDILNAAKEKSLTPCALELAPYLRLQYLSQPDGSLLTIASVPPFPDEMYPRGFYLSSNSTGLWLRGYRATEDVLWAPDSEFVFVKPYA